MLQGELVAGYGAWDAGGGLVDDVWSLMGIDGVEDVTIAINSSPNKL